MFRNQPDGYPPHRLPEWAKSQVAYNANINSVAVPRGAGVDYGVDNFSYDPVHVPKWQMPKDTAKYLPKELFNAANDFVYAGAAINTALERIAKLQREAGDRANPTQTHAHLFEKASKKDESPCACAKISTPVPASSSPFIPAAFASSRRRMNPLPANMIGMESPPFTPVDSKGTNTPTTNRAIGPNGTDFDADLKDIDFQIALSMQDSLTIGPSGETIVVHNRKAWETYARTWNAEVRDAQSYAWKRLRGYGQVIDKLLYEIGIEQHYSDKTRAAVERFSKWWKGTKPMVSEFKARVDALPCLILEEDEGKDENERREAVYGAGMLGFPS